MKALVTGAGGFLGAHLVARLVTDGWAVTGTVRPRGSRARLEVLGMAGEVEVLEVDLADPAATRAAVARAGPHVVFLLGAVRGMATPADRASTCAVNVSSAGWVVDALPDRCRAVVRVGSSTEYGAVDGPMGEDAPVRPRGFFGATKAAGSRLTVAAAAGRGLRSVVVRPFQVYGPLDHPTRLVPTALQSAARGEPLLLTEPGRCRDWVFVDDVVEACVRAAGADHVPSGQVLNVGTGIQVANEELVARIERVSGRPIDVRTGAHRGRSWDTSSWVADPSRARALLGWEAKVDLDNGLARCWAFQPWPERPGPSGGRGFAIASHR